MRYIVSFRPRTARNKGFLAASLTAALLASTALPAFAGADTATTQPASQVEDAGPVAASTPLTAMVWLKGHNQAQFDAAVASRYDVNSASYQRWMTPEEVANFGPTASDVATLKASL